MPPAIATTATSWPPHASEIWLHPLGAVAIAGPGGQQPLLQGPARQARRHRQRLSRRHLQSRRSSPTRATTCRPKRARMRQALAGALLETWREDVDQGAPGRGQVDAYLRDPVAVADSAGGDLGKAALAGKLVDKLGERRAFEARLAELGGSRRFGQRAATSRSSSTTSSRTGRRPRPERPDRRRHRRRRDRRRQGAARARPAATASPRPSKRACATTT